MLHVAGFTLGQFHVMQLSNSRGDTGLTKSRYYNLRRPGSRAFQLGLQPVPVVVCGGEIYRTVIVVASTSRVTL